MLVKWFDLKEEAWFELPFLLLLLLPEFLDVKLSQVA